MATRMKKTIADPGREDDLQVDPETLSESLDSTESEVAAAGAEEESPEPVPPVALDSAPAPEKSIIVPVVELSSGVDSAGFPLPLELNAGNK